MAKRGAPLSPLMARVLLGCCLSFLAASFAPLWEVSPTGRFDRRGRGNFWAFLGELPSALQNNSAAQGPSAGPATPPGAGWRNVRTTLIVLAAGAGLGYVVWALRHLPPLTPPNDQPP